LAAEHLQQVVDVGVRAGAAAGEASARGALAAAEHGGEDVLEAGAAGTPLAGGEAGTAGAHGADRVVLLALLGIVEDGVRLADLLEHLLSLGVIGVVVGVELAGLGAVGLLDLLRARVLGAAEDRVEVLVEPVLSGHQPLLPGASGASGSYCWVLLRAGGNAPGRGPSGSDGPRPGVMVAPLRRGLACRPARGAARDPSSRSRAA